MQFSVVLIAAATLGTDYGWQPLDDGQLEYIIQIDPAFVAAMQRGQDVTSELDPRIRGVRRFRIKIGSDPLPQVGVMPLIVDDPPKPLPNTTDGGKPIQTVSADERIGKNTNPENKGNESDATSDESQTAPSSDTEPEKPWIWLTAALLGLFVSLGANVYLGWIMLAIRRQYHKVVSEMVGRA